MFYKRLHRYFACRWISEIARTPTETKAILMRIPLLPRGAVAVPLFSTCAKEVGVDLGEMDRTWEWTERLLGGVREPTKMIFGRLDSHPPPHHPPLLDS